MEMYGTSYPEEGDNQEEYWQQLIQDPSVGPNNNTSAVNNVRKYKKTSDKNASSAVTVWLRSAIGTNSYYVCLVNTTGNIIFSNGAYNARAGVPACAIY